MENAEKKHRIYDRVLKSWIDVEDAVYKKYCRMINNYRDRQKYHGRCCCPSEKWWYCNMICDNCVFCRAKELLSLDAEIKAGEGTISYAELLPDPNTDVERTAIHNVTLETLHKRLQSLSPRDQRIYQLISEDKSEREIARILKLPRSNTRRYIKKLREDLRRDFEDFS